MPRRPRIVLPNTPLHLIQRGNNRQACFFADEDYRVNLDWLARYASEAGCRIPCIVGLASTTRTGKLCIGRCSIMNWSRVWPMRCGKRRMATSRWGEPLCGSGRSGVGKKGCARESGAAFQTG